MDADVAALQRFADVPYVIEVPASRPEAGVPAAIALANAKVTLDEGKGVPNPLYRTIVEDVRRQVAEQVKARHDYRIEIVDLSSDDVRGEIGRASSALKGKEAKTASTFEAMGAAAILVPEGDGKAACLIAGHKPTMTFERQASYGANLLRMKQGPLSDEAYHRITLFHEVGHCLLGADEAKADTFGALMAVRFTDLSRDALSTYAAYREATEYVATNVQSTHVMSRPLWAVAMRMDDLRADPEFMAMDANDIARLAQAFVAKEGPKPEDMAHIVAFRAAYDQASNAEAHRPRDGGRPIPFFRWTREVGVDLPEIARLIEVQRGLSEGRVVEPPGSRRTVDDLKVSLEGMVAKGDTTAKVMLETEFPGVSRAAEANAIAWQTMNPYRFDGSAMAGFVDGSRKAPMEENPQGPRF